MGLIIVRSLTNPIPISAIAFRLLPTAANSRTAHSEGKRPPWVRIKGPNVEHGNSEKQVVGLGLLGGLRFDKMLFHCLPFVTWQIYYSMGVIGSYCREMQHQFSVISALLNRVASMVGAVVPLAGSLLSSGHLFLTLSYFGTGRGNTQEICAVQATSREGERIQDLFCSSSPGRGMVRSGVAQLAALSC